MSGRSHRRSKAHFQRAKKSIVGGVNSPVRAYGAVKGTPPFIWRGFGAEIIDVDGNRYVDYVMSWGPLILGHSALVVVEAVMRAARDGLSFGAPTALETELAEEVRDAFPSMDLLRMVNSGTEAVMSVLRLARAFTKRDKAIKFDGGYHGHSDALLVKAGSGLATLGRPSSPGVPKSVTADTISLRYNDAGAVADCLKERPDDVAAILVEPVAGNMGVVPPKEGFLEALRELATKHGVLLVFDEVITGFRVARGGAQELFGVTPDLTVLGKIIGGGMPVGCYGGRKEIMKKLAPLGPVYQAGTLSGNPVAMAAGLATLRELRAPGIYGELESKAGKLAAALKRSARKSKTPVTVNRVGSMMTLFFNKGPVTHYEQALASDTERFARWHEAMLERGIYLAPSQFEAMFVSAVHTEAHIRATVNAAEEVFEGL